MINGIRLKVCGLTSLVDAEAADGVGADYLGFILYPPSPRHVSLAPFRAMVARLPPGKKVAVCVQPTAADLADYVSAGFDYFQVHFSADTPVPQMAPWTETVGAARLWLAPKLPPERDIDATWLPLADTFLLDTFRADKFGGTGETGDWAKFRRHAEAHPKKHWILSGGLNAANIAEALAVSGARHVDVNSGVEHSPGVKAPAKLKAFVAALHNATKHENPAY